MTASTTQRAAPQGSAKPEGQNRDSVLPPYPTAPSNIDDELAREKAELEHLTAWMSSPRFAHVRRPYGPADVLRLRGTLQASNPTIGAYRTDRKFFELVRRMFDSNMKLREQGGSADGSDYKTGAEHSCTFGCLDAMQVACMAQSGLTSIYVSGWQCSSMACQTTEPGPDLADYPYTTVPDKVKQLFLAQQLHDRKQREARSRMTREQRAETPVVDYFVPIVADGDTGHGGNTAVMKLARLMIESGAAGIHIEDQKPGAKKCGHMGGKVLVATREQVDRLIAARLQADLLGSELVVVGRTDSEAARLLDSNIDERDHRFILGTTRADLEPLNRVRRQAAERGESTASVEAKWLEEARLCTFEQAVASALTEQLGDKAPLRAWTEFTTPAWKELPIDVMRRRARELLAEGAADEAEIDRRWRDSGLGAWDWDKPRTREGFYRIEGGVNMSVTRGLAMAPHADLLWMETGKPDLEEARTFAEGVHRSFPHAVLAYNLSPSFNWSNFLDEKACRRYTYELARLGFVWQFITLAGYHADALITTQLARAFASDEAMWAYVQRIQNAERSEKVDALRHQVFSGAELIDSVTQVVAGGASSTSILQAGCTEVQFT